MTTWLDTETFGETPIKDGTYKYAANCEVDIFAYAIDDGPVTVLDMTAKPAENRSIVSDLLLDSDDIIVAHNSMFDRNALRLGNLKIDVPIHRWRCSMVRALAHGLPGSLDTLGEILGIEQDKKKHKAGKDLMRLFCKPLPKNSKLRRATHHTHPDEWARYLAYAGNDIEAMRAINAKLPSWNYTTGELPEDRSQWKACHRELNLWHLDQMINDRGFMVDTDLARAALRAVDREQARLSAKARERTDGYVSAATQRDRMLEHILMEFGVDLPDLRGSTVERLLDNSDIDEGLKELLRIRLQASTTSTAKYKALLKAVNDDDRLRGTLQFDGAARTRRDAGRTFQPQNLPSRGLLPHEETEFGIEAMKADAEDLLVPDVMKLASSAIRGCIIAPPGKKLVVADLSNIEGRGLAWLAGEEWKLQAFRDFDAGTGPDLYKLAYAKSFNIPHEEVTKAQRQIGKVQELGLGYAGGINAFVTFANVYGIDLEEMAKTAWEVLPGDMIAEADDFVTWLAGKGTSFPMSHRAAVVCEVFKRSWRQAHPATVALWRALEDGFKDAVKYPGKTFTAGRFKIRRDGVWLRFQLPSGRFLCYPSPEVDDEGQCSYMGINQYTRKWQRIKTYSGRLAENMTQSFSRDILFDNFELEEAAGYQIVMRVHDEVITEAPDSPEFNAEHLSALLATNPPYAPDMPLAAAGFETLRYRKE